MNFQAVSTTRGLSIPDEIEPDQMFQIGDGRVLVILAADGVMYCRRNGEWYRMEKWSPKAAKAAQLKPEPVPVEELEETAPPSQPAPPVAPDAPPTDRTAAAAPAAKPPAKAPAKKRPARKKAAQSRA